MRHIRLTDVVVFLDFRFQEFGAFVAIEEPDTFVVVGRTQHQRNQFIDSRRFRFSWSNSRGRGICISPLKRRFDCCVMKPATSTDFAIGKVGCIIMKPCRVGFPVFEGEWQAVTTIGFEGFAVAAALDDVTLQRIEI